MKCSQTRKAEHGERDRAMFRHWAFPGARCPSSAVEECPVSRSNLRNSGFASRIRCPASISASTSALCSVCVVGAANSIRRVCSSGKSRKLTGM